MNLAQLIDFERIETERDLHRVPGAATTPPKTTVHLLRTTADLPPTPTEVKVCAAAGVPEEIVAPRRGERDRAAVRALRDHPESSAPELAALLGIKPGTASILLCHLVDIHWVKKAGKRRSYRFSASSIGLRKC